MASLYYSAEATACTLHYGEITYPTLHLPPPYFNTPT